MKALGAVNPLSAVVSKVSKTRHLTSLQPAETAEKNLCCLLKIDITSVIDVNENEHTSRRYAVVFF